MKYIVLRHIVERFICVSPDIAAYIMNHGVPENRIAVIPNGVDLDYFRPPTSEERQDARKELGITDLSQPAVLFFGRDAVIKGADRLAAALGFLQQPAHVLCVASSKESIALLSQNPDVRVHDLGVVSDMRKVLWAANVLALPSRIEALPFAVLEARATGLPVVASNLPGLRTFAEDSGTILIPFAEPPESVQIETYARNLQNVTQQRSSALPTPLADSISLTRWVERIRALYSDPRLNFRQLSLMA